MIEIKISVHKREEKTMGKQHWKPGNMLNPVPAVMVSVTEFAKTGLTPIPMEHVHAMGIDERPVNMECKITEKRELGSHTMFIAEVVGVTVDDRYMDETGKFHINESGLVMYSHGEYFALGKKLGKFGYSVKKK